MSIEILKVPDYVWNHKCNSKPSQYFQYSSIPEFIDYIFKKFNYENLFYDFTANDENKYILLRLYTNNVTTNGIAKSLDETKSIILRIKCYFNSDNSMLVLTIPERSDVEDGINNPSTIKYYVTKDTTNNYNLSPCNNGVLNEYNIISGIIATPSCISFEFRYCNQILSNETYEKIKPSSYQLVLSKTKKGNWAIITPFATPAKESLYHQKIIENNEIKKYNYYSKNNIVCYSLNSSMKNKYEFTSGELGKHSAIMSFESIPVLDDNDYCLGCYFNFHSTLNSQGIIIVDDTKYYYNGWLSIEE